MRGRDEEGRARDGPGRRLARGPGARQDPPRRAGPTANLDPRPRRGGHQLPRRQRPRDDPSPLPRVLAHDDDVARGAAGEPLLPRRRDDHRLLSHEHHAPRSEDDEHARQQYPLRPRHGPSRADPGPSPSGLHGRAIQGLSPAIQHAVLRRRAGRSTGSCCSGIAGSPNRPRTGSACYSGACTAAPGSSSR